MLWYNLEFGFVAIFRTSEERASLEKYLSAINELFA